MSWLKKLKNFLSYSPDYDIHIPRRLSLPSKVEYLCDGIYSIVNVWNQNMQIKNNETIYGFLTDEREPREFIFKKTKRRRKVYLQFFEKGGENYYQVGDFVWFEK